MVIIFYLICLSKSGMNSINSRTVNMFKAYIDEEVFGIKHPQLLQWLILGYLGRINVKTSFYNLKHINLKFFN